MADEDTSPVGDQLNDDHVVDVMSKFAKKQKKVLDEQKKALDDERGQDEKRRQIENEVEDEDIRKRIKSRSVVEFQYYVDFVSIAIIGLVFFLTCLSGLLNGVSQKMLSIRAIVSVAIVSAVVYICRSVIMKLFHMEKEQEAEENEKKDEEEDKDQKIDE